MTSALKSIKDTVKQEEKKKGIEKGLAKEKTINGMQANFDKLREQLKKKQIEMKKTEAEYKRDSGGVGRYEKDVSDLQGKFLEISYEEGTAERLELHHRQIRQEVNSLKTQVKTIILIFYFVF